MTSTIANHLTDRRHRWEWYFWAIVLLMGPAGSLIGNGQTLMEGFTYRFVGLIPKMVAGYFIAYWLIPRVLHRRRYWLFVTLIPVSIVAFTFLARLLNVHLAERLLTPGGERETLWEMMQQWHITVAFYFDRVFVIALWFTFMKVGIDHSRGKEQLARLREEKATAELSLLKSQIHPHFLFNTLNNLYALSVEQSPDAPEVIERLSGILDYQLYQCNAPRVTVTREIAMIDNYIHLERLRYGERLDLSFSHRSDDPGAQIAPLLLITPVENAFKHGASGNDEAPAIDIELTVANGRLTFRVWNNRAASPVRDANGYTNGIGLNNLRRQLTLIYPGRHRLEVTKTEGEYEVTMTITLTDD